MLGFVFPHFVNGHDIRVLQLSDGRGLGAEALHVRRAGELPSQDHLYRDGAVQTYLPRPVNHAHATAGDFLQQFVVAEVADFLWRR